MVCELLFVVFVFSLFHKIKWQQSRTHSHRQRKRRQNVARQQKDNKSTEVRGRVRRRARVRLTISDNYEHNIKITQCYEGIKKHTEAKNHKANSGNCSMLTTCSSHFGIVVSYRSIYKLLRMQTMRMIRVGKKRNGTK